MTVPSGNGSIQRVFLGWDEPALLRAAGTLAEWYAGPHELDLRRVVVVTPAARAGRRLGELLLDEAEARGAALVPPGMVTMGRFPELLYQPTKPLADATISRLAFARALQDVEPGVLDVVFPTRPGKMAGWVSLGGVVESLHREVGAEGLDFREVSRAFRRGFPYDDSVRWDVLAEVQERYLKVLDRMGLRDRDRERRLALDEGRLKSPGDIWMMGVVELPGLVKEMVRALPGPLHALVHAPREISERFDGMGCIIPEAWASAPIPIRDDRIRVAPRPPDQADSVVEVVRGFSGRFGAEEIVVGVPDPELVPFVERSLSMAGLSHRFAGGSLLADTGPVRLLMAVAEYLDGRSFPSFGSLIRHPDLFEILDDAEGARSHGDDPSQPHGQGGSAGGPEATGPLTIADRFQSRHLQASVLGSLPGEDKDARRMRGLVQHLESALALNAFEGIRRISEWMPPVLELLVTVYARGPVDVGKRAGRQLVEGLARIKSVAGRLALLPSMLDDEVLGAEALYLLLAELRGETIPPDPEEHALELLGWLELPLDDAPAVIITAMNDRHIPEAQGADPFLPGGLRSHLKISDDAARYSRDAYLLSALTNSREEVHLVVGRLTAAGDPLRPSRLLFAGSEEEVAKRVQRFLAEEDVHFLHGRGGDGLPGGLAGVLLPEPPGSLPISRLSRFQSPPVNPIPPLEALPRIRVTDFSSYLADPYRHVLTRVLKLEPLDDGSREMEGTTFGSLAHLVLERFGASEEASSEDEGVVARKLDRLLDGALFEEFGRRPVPAVRIQGEQLRARLHAFARWQARWAEGGWRIQAVECQPEPGVPFLVDGEPVLLRGKIDRIDHNPRTGEWALFDYKTGDGGGNPEDAHRKGRGGRKVWVDLQLPLYRRLLEEVRDGNGELVVPRGDQATVSLGYLLLPKRLDGVGPAFADWTQNELTEAEEVARAVVRDLRSKPFTYDPGIRGYPDDPLDALLGRKGLPQATDGDGDSE